MHHSTPTDPIGPYLAEGFKHAKEISDNERLKTGSDSTVIARIQNARSLVCGRLRQDAAFEIHEEYSYLGKVHYVHTETGNVYLVKSKGRFSEIVRQASEPQIPGFESEPLPGFEKLQADINLVFYKIVASLLIVELGIAKEILVGDTVKFVLTGPLTIIGKYELNEPLDGNGPMDGPDDLGGPPIIEGGGFDQGPDDDIFDLDVTGEDRL